MLSAALWRRRAAGVTCLIVALIGGPSIAAPARARQALDPQVAFMDVCDATYVAFVSDLELDWFIRVDGQDYWPGEDDEQPAPGEIGVVYVPADADLIRVNYQGSTADWPRDHSWTYPGGECELLPPDITHQQPTCDVDGEIEIPDTGVEWLLNGELVEPGSVHPVEPGIHVVEILGLYNLSLFLDGVDGEAELLVSRTWTVEIRQPDCPDEDPRGVAGDEDAGGGADGAGNGAGGELPAIGVPVGLVAAPPSLPPSRSGRSQPLSWRRRRAGIGAGRSYIGTESPISRRFASGATSAPLATGPAASAPAPSSSA